MYFKPTRKVTLHEKHEKQHAVAFNETLELVPVFRNAHLRVPVVLYRGFQ